MVGLRDNISDSLILSFIAQKIWLIFRREKDAKIFIVYGICHLPVQLILYKGAKAIQWEENSFSQQMVLGKLDILMKKDEFSIYLISYKF